LKLILNCSSSSPFEARYVPQSVRMHLLGNPSFEQYRFELKTGSKAFDVLASLAYSLTVILELITFFVLIFILGNSLQDM
jgi:hypothetical protein